MTFPQRLRACGQVGRVAEHPQGLQSAYASPDAVQATLDPVSDRSIVVVVGKERVVDKRLRSSPIA